MSNREAILRKLAALRAKTTRSGCTEAEAVSAAEAAARIMDEHGISESEIGIVEARARANSRARWVLTLSAAVKKATNTGAIFVADHAEIAFVGLDPAPEIAAYLFDVTRRSVERELRAFRETTWYKRRRTQKAKSQAGSEFCNGMAARLAIRVVQIFSSQINPALSKKSEQALEVRYSVGETIRPRAGSQRYDHARYAGINAAESVTLAHGINGSEGRRAIGGRA
jgi:hypothetical protein